MKKETAFNDAFNLKHVITKVSAKNFYMHKNRNIYQFLLENCLRGISHAIIFEKGNLSIGETNLMKSIIAEANDESNILPVSGRTFKFDDLKKILNSTNDKFNMMYNKFYYGFEKEGKASVYSEKSVQGYYFKFQIPLREDLLVKNLFQIFCKGIKDPKSIIPKSETICDFKVEMPGQEEEENKENQRPEDNLQLGKSKLTSQPEEEM